MVSNGVEEQCEGLEDDQDQHKLVHRVDLNTMRWRMMMMIVVENDDGDEDEGGDDEEETGEHGEETEGWF